MDSRLNFFAPYERVPAWHENQLTRALLVVLRYSPAAHEIWLRMVAPHKHLHALGKAEFATQRKRILERGQEIAEEEAIPGISVWLAPDAQEVAGEVTESERNQILDGIITYGTDLVVVIENRITWSQVTQQPRQINLHGSQPTQSPVDMHTVGRQRRFAASRAATGRSQCREFPASCLTGASVMFRGGAFLRASKGSRTGLGNR